MIKQKLCRIAKLFGKARPNKALIILFGLWVSLVSFYRLFFESGLTTHQIGSQSLNSTLQDFIHAGFGFSFYSRFY